MSKMSKEESRELSRLIFDKLSQRDPITELTVKIEVNRFTAKQCIKESKQCRAEGNARLARMNIRLAKVITALVENDRKRLTELRAKSKAKQRK